MYNQLLKETQKVGLEDTSNEDALRKSLGICKCGEAEVYYRKLGKRVCKKCNPNIGPDREMNAEEKRQEKDWDEAEHEHMPA